MTGLRCLDRIWWLFGDYFPKLVDLLFGVSIMRPLLQRRAFRRCEGSGGSVIFQGGGLTFSEKIFPEMLD